MLDLIPCEHIPYVLLAISTSGLAAWVFVWARKDTPVEPAWKWGDKPRRPPGPLTGVVSHLIGCLCCGFAVSYVLHHQLCG